jgi:hypothetical protein
MHGPGPPRTVPRTRIKSASSHFSSAQIGQVVKKLRRYPQWECRQLHELRSRRDRWRREARLSTAGSPAGACPYPLSHELNQIAFSSMSTSQSVIVHQSSAVHAHPIEVSADEAVDTDALRKHDNKIVDRLVAMEARAKSGAARRGFRTASTTAYTTLVNSTRPLHASESRTSDRAEMRGCDMHWLA